MLHITDAMVDELVNVEEAQSVLTQAFLSFSNQEAAMQERIRTEADGVKLSTLGAVIPSQGYLGAKVYTTIAGKFEFVILLFSAIDGKPLASFDAGSITRLRTAACSVIVAKKLAPPKSKVLAILGAGVQGQEHALQMAKAFDLEQIYIYSPNTAENLTKKLTSLSPAKVSNTGIEAAVECADIIVTATRSKNPLFSGNLIPKNCFISAVGSSLPTTRELDDVALERCSTIIVEWRNQSLKEAGDLVLAPPKLKIENKIQEIGELLQQENIDPLGINIYKSVGVGLEDIALAGLAYEKVQAKGLKN
jgi:ornithine cyclodeaminase